MEVVYVRTARTRPVAEKIWMTKIIFDDYTVSQLISIEIKENYTKKNFFKSYIKD